MKRIEIEYKCQACNGTGIRGNEDRKHSCPAWWYQVVGYGKKPEWKECGFGRFSDCEHFKDKGKCWNKFDNEQKIERSKK